MLSAPRTGRTVYVLLPDHSLAPGTAKRGSTLRVHADGAKDGLRTDAVYEVRLDGPSGKVLDRVVSDGSGNIEDSVRIPASTVPGGHRIDLTGENQNGSP